VLIFGAVRPDAAGDQLVLPWAEASAVRLLSSERILSFSVALWEPSGWARALRSNRPYGLKAQLATILGFWRTARFCEKITPTMPTRSSGRFWPLGLCSAPRR
jgi:hypothetical protein